MAAPDIVLDVHQGSSRDVAPFFVRCVPGFTCCNLTDIRNGRRCWWQGLLIFLALRLSRHCSGLCLLLGSFLLLFWLRRRSWRIVVPTTEITRVSVNFHFPTIFQHQGSQRIRTVIVIILLFQSSFFLFSSSCCILAFFCSCSSRSRISTLSLISSNSFSSCMRFSCMLLVSSFNHVDLIWPF